MKKLYKVIKEKDCCLDGIHLSTLKVGQELELNIGLAKLLGSSVVEEVKFERVKEKASVVSKPEVKKISNEAPIQKRTRRSREQMEADEQAAREAK